MVSRIVLFPQQVPVEYVNGDVQKALEYMQLILLACKMSEIIPRVERKGERVRFPRTGQATVRCSQKGSWSRKK